jgi:multidrug efflux pump subunit AcrA (membrane-fusion protein)
VSTRKGVRLALAVAVAAALTWLFLCACAAPARQSPEPTPWPTPIVPDKPTYVVQRGDLADRFTLRGQVAPVTWQPLYFAVDGRLAVLSVTVGSAVQQGDVLAELEARDLVDAHEQARLSLESAQDQLVQQEKTRSFALKRAQLDLRSQQLLLQEMRGTAERAGPIELAQAAAELDQARATLQVAQAAYNKVATQPDVGSTPQAAALENATNAYRIADARYQLKLTGADSTAIARQEIEVKRAELAVQELEGEPDPAIQRAVTTAQIQVGSLERQIEQRRLRAPFSGQVIALGLKVQGFEASSATRPKVGDAIPAFLPIVVLARPDRLEVVLDASSERANELVVGETVTLTHYLAQERPMAAKVTALPLSSLDATAAAGEPRLIHIALPPDAPPVAIGDPVTVDVLAALHAHTLFLPPEALRSFGGRTFVVTTDAGRERRVAITVGLQNQDQVEILSGLAEGDKVIGP